MIKLTHIKHIYTLESFNSKCKKGMLIEMNENKSEFIPANGINNVIGVYEGNGTVVIKGSVNVLTAQKGKE